MREESSVMIMVLHLRSSSGISSAHNSSPQASEMVAAVLQWLIWQLLSSAQGGGGDKECDSYFSSHKGSRGLSCADAAVMVTAALLLGSMVPPPPA